MSEIRLTISDETMAHLRERASETGCGTPEAYLQGLLEKDLAPDYDEDLEALLLERVNGPWHELTPELEERLQAEVLENLKIKAKADA
jgi:hypothetical protein